MNERSDADLEITKETPARGLIAVLAKAPQIGKVKTRMRERLSDAQALKLHTWCLYEIAQVLLPQVQAESAQLGSSMSALFYVTEPHSIWDDLGLGDSPRLQVRDHLGAKMWAALSESFDQLDREASKVDLGGDRDQRDAVLLLGTDSPHLDPGGLARGLSLLNSSAQPLVVVGPAEDGGYYTIGCNRAALPLMEALFSREIPWGTSTVLSETRARAQRQGIELRELSLDFDLDRPADLDRLAHQDPERWKRLEARLTPHPLTPPCTEPLASKYHSALARLFGLTRFGERLDLSAPRAINEALGRPLDAYHNLLIGGTNGKGSTCAALLQLAATCGVRLGCFTSPHLISFRERVRVGDALISPMRVIEGVEVIFEAAERAQITLSFFEATWALAAWHFAQEGVEWVVWEVGLGGRLDATNVCEPEVSAIVSISLDHTHILGDTVEAIAAEKAPIFRDSGRSFTAARGEALSALRAVSPSQLSSLEESLPPEAWSILEGAHRDAPSMASVEHGQRNLGLAWVIAEAAGWSPPLWGATPKDESVVAWWSAARWPGRLEELEGVWLDCAHNPESAIMLSRWLSSHAPTQATNSSRARHLIVGMSADKDQSAVLTSFAHHCEHLTFVSPSYPRCADAEVLFDVYQRLVEPSLSRAGERLPHVSIISSIADALRARDPNAITLVTGSCFAVGEARAWLLGVPFPEAGITTNAR